MSLSRAKAAALPLSLLAAGLFAVGGTVAAHQDEDQKAEPNDKPSAKAEAGSDQSQGRKPQEAPNRDQVMRDRQQIARLSVTVANNEENPQTKAVLEALDQPFTLQLAEDSTLGDLVDQIKESLTTADGEKVPVYVDPRGIEEVGAALGSPVVIDLENAPLKLSLRLALKQLDLAYCVREGELMGRHPEQVIIGPGGPNFMGGGMGGMGGGMMR